MPLQAYIKRCVVSKNMHPFIANFKSLFTVSSRTSILDVCLMKAMIEPEIRSYSACLPLLLIRVIFLLAIYISNVFKHIALGR